MLRRRPGGLPYPKSTLGAPAVSITPWTSEARVPLVMGPPQPERRPLIDFLPNLLVTTLFAVAMFPPGQQVSASAPPPKYQVQCEPQPRNLALGINPNPPARQQSDSAPPPKYAVQCEQHHNRLTLGINPNPAVRQLFDSAPPPKYAVQIDQWPAYPGRVSISTNPAIVQLFTSAPPLKYQLQPDQPLQRPLTLGINPNPAVQRWDQSAPVGKPRWQTDHFPNLTATTLQRPVLPVDTNVGKSKYQVQSDVSPNLLLTTLQVRRPSVPVDSGQWQAKYQVYSDVLPNEVLYRFTLPPAPIVMPNVVGVNYYMALQILQAAGVYVPLKSYAFTPSSISIAWARTAYAGGIVTAQSLAAGLAVAANQNLTLTVSMFPFSAEIDSPPDWKQ